MASRFFCLLVLLCVELLFGQKLFAQTVISIEPFYGIHQMYNFIKNSSNSHPNFKTNVFDIGFQLGGLANLQYKRLPKITTGFMVAEAGTTARLNTGPLSQNPYLSYRSTHVTGRTLYKFPLLLSYPVKRVNWIGMAGKTGASFRYLINCKVEPFLGFSFDRLQSMRPAAVWRSYLLSMRGDTLLYRTSKTSFKRQNGGSILAGIKLQFIRKTKSFFSLNIYYNQGIMNYLDTDYIYIINGRRYNTVVGTRGSLLAIHLSYPITIYNSAKRKQLIKFEP